MNREFEMNARIDSKTMAEYGKTFESVYSAQPGKLTFKQWRQSAQAIRDLIEQRLLEDRQRKVDIDAEYSPQFAATRKKALDEFDADLIQAGRNVITQNLAEVMDAKREAFAESMKAPSESQVRLLQTLALRRHLDTSEIAMLADQVKDNLLALSTLADIASRHGVAFPRLPTPASVEADIAEMSKVAEKYMPGLSQFDEDLTYEQKLFWQTSGTFRESPLFDSLDGPFILDTNAIYQRREAEKAAQEQEEADGESTQDEAGGGDKNAAE